MDMKALIARMDAIAEANRPADYNAERDHPLTQYDDDPKPDSAAKPSSSSSEPDSDGDRSKGDAPIVHRDAEKDGVPGVNNTPGPDSDAANYDFAPQGSDNPPGGPQAADDKTKTAQDATDQLDKDNGAQAQDQGAPDPTEVSRFADLLMKCKDSGWRVPINPATAQQAVKSAEKLSEAYLTESPALLRLLATPALTGRLRSAFLQSLGMSKKLRLQLYKMNPQAFKTGNFTAQQKQLIQNYTSKTQASGRITRSNVRQTAQNLKDDPRIAQDLTRASQGGIWSTLGKVATIGTLGWLGYEAYKALFGEKEEELSPGGGDMAGSQSPKPGGAGGAGQTQPCLNPQEIADLDKMASSWQNVNDPSIKALVAAWSTVKPIMTKTTESKGTPMDMKNLIAQMDAIETGKKFIAESVAPVKEYKGGTDAEKIKNWQQHIKNFDAFPKAQDDARQAAKKAQPGAKFYKTDDKPQKEGMGSIARTLMQSMGMDDKDIDEAFGYKTNRADVMARQASGELPPAGWNNEVNGPWMGNTEQVPVQAASGGNVQAASGGNVVSNVPAGQKRPGQAFPRDAVDSAIDATDAAAGQAAQAAIDQQNLANMDMQVGQGAQRGPVAGGQSADPGYKPGETVDTWREPSGVSQTTFTPPTPGPAPAPGGQPGANADDAMVQANNPPGSGLKWPTTDAEIRAFQQKAGLKVDGMIGKNTYNALVNKAGLTPPPGFKIVANKTVPPVTGGQSGKPNPHAVATGDGNVKAWADRNTTGGGLPTDGVNKATGTTGGQSPQPSQPGQGDADVAQAMATRSQAAATPAAAPAAQGKEALNTADKNQPYWINGQEYTWGRMGDGRIGWSPVNNTLAFKPSTHQKRDSKYTGPDSGFQATQESLQDDRILAMIRDIRI